MSGLRRGLVRCLPSCAVVGLLAVGSVEADIHNVSPGESVQAAIDAADASDEVVVAEGTYVERINFKGKAITVRSTDPSDPAVVAATIIDGDAAGSVVTFSSGEGSGSVLAGLTVTNGSGTDDGSGGLLGGGIYCDGSSPTISDNTISGNTTSALGGGIYCRASSPTIFGNTVSGNSASYHGGGICCAGSSPTISRNTISGNSAGYDGGGVSSYAGGSPTISGNTISGNSAKYGGGIAGDLGSSPVILNSIIAFSVSGGGLYAGLAAPSVSYCDVYGNAGGDYVGMGDPTGSDGNISVDPLFANATGGDFHLQSTFGRWDPVTSVWVIDRLQSPCIDAADPAADYGNEPWRNGRRLNMGVYGNTAEASKSPDYSAPTAPTLVTVAPPAPHADDDLTASASGATDADDDPLTYEYEWSKTTDGGASWTEWENSADLAADFGDRTDAVAGGTLDHRLTVKGEEWKARAKAYDGLLYGPWAESEVVTIQDTAPATPTAVAIDPEAPLTGDDLTVSASGSTDADGDPVTYGYEWAVSGDGSLWGDWGNPGEILPASETAKGEYWKARAWAVADGQTSAPVESAPVSIGDTPPTEPTAVAIEPTAPKAEDDLTASASGSTDDDGETVAYEYEWAKSADGATWAAWGNPGETLPSSETASGDCWKARARAVADGETSAWVESANHVRLDNAAPTAPTLVDVTPGSPGTEDDLTASASGATDADGDTLTYEYEWSKTTDGGASWSQWSDREELDKAGADGSSDNVLDHRLTAKGEEWKARARAYDGLLYGAWAESDAVTIGNSPPTLAWLGVPGFLADGHDPQAGAPDTTEFALRVRITDPDGTAPAEMTVEVRRVEDCRTWVTIATLPLSPLFGAWTTGMMCGATTTLPNGAYRYCFYAEDDEGAVATGDPTAWCRGPKLIGPPQLWCTGLPGREGDYLHPETGTEGETRFKFSVQCTDGEGDRPIPHRIRLQRKRADGTWGGFCNEIMATWSGGLRSGKYYNFQRKLRAGEYRYRFVFADDDGPATGSDSAGPDGTQWQPGPAVSEATADGIASSGGATVTSLAAIPSPGGVQIVFSLSAPMSVDARILNIAGRPVKTLCRAQDCEAGANTLLWNAMSDQGLPVPNGTYLIQVMAKGDDGAQARALAQVRINR